MDLDPDKNIYVRRLKEVIEDCMNKPCGYNHYQRLVDGLELNENEEIVLNEYFLMPDKLNFDFASADEITHLKQVVFKYFRVDLELQAEEAKLNIEKTKL
jgi:hypothetical protein